MKEVLKMPDKNPKKGDIVYCRKGGEIYECIVVEVSNDYRSKRSIMVEPLDGTGHIFITTSDQLCSLSEMQRQQAELCQLAEDMWRERCENESYPTVEEDYDCDIDNREPPLEKSDLNDRQLEYEMLYNAVGSVWGIMTTLIEFADSGREIGTTALLALRDRADSLDAPDIVKAIDDYMNRN
jgi:hypothetical protein